MQEARSVKQALTYVAGGRLTASVCLLLCMLTAFAQSPDWVAKSRQASQALRSGRFREAVSLYRELTHALPDNPGLAMNLGLALHSAGQYPDAVQQFQSVLKMDPKLAPAWFLLALDLQKLDRPMET